MLNAKSTVGILWKLLIKTGIEINVTFQKYLKNSAGKTYSDAVNEWYKIQEDKKRNKGQKSNKRCSGSY